MNRYPLWKYLLIGATLVIGLLYTVPNFFGEVPAVQITALKGAQKADTALMRQSGNEQEEMVLGSGLGGLVAGTLLSKNNRSVLLLREKRYRPFYAKKGYHFVPFSNFSEKQLWPGLIKKISQALYLPLLMENREEGKQTKISSDRSKEKAAIQVVLPKSRVDIFPQRSLSQKEWKREFPKELIQIEKFYNELNQTQHLLQKVKQEKNASPFFPLRRRSFINKLFPFDSLPKGKMDEKLFPFSRAFRELIQLQLISWGYLVFTPDYQIDCGS